VASGFREIINERKSAIINKIEKTKIIMGVALITNILFMCYFGKEVDNNSKLTFPMVLSGLFLVFYGSYYMTCYLSSYEKSNKTKKIYKKMFTQYMDCPLCEHSVEIIDNWTCPSCDKKNISFVTDPCIRCRKEMKTGVCEKCEQEFTL